MEAMSISDRIMKISPLSFAGRAIRLPLRLVPRNIEVPVLSGINRGMHWITGAGTTNASWIGHYEADHVFALRQLVHPGSIAFDLGANAGFYTLALSRLVGDSGHVYCFEPEAGNAYLLRRHIEINKLRNVTFVQAAISDSTGMVGFDGALKSASGEITSGGSYLIPSISLDEFIAAGNPPPSFIKMDIEGAEEMALEGAKNLLSKQRPAWLVATHTNELTASCRKTLTGYGYRLTGFDCASDPGNAADFIAIPISRA
jgi:FkbM family methyltransferase